MANIIRQGKAQLVILYSPEDDIGLENAEVIVYDTGLVSIKTAHEDLTSHIMRTEVIWSMSCPHEDVKQDEVEPKLFHLNRLKKKTEDTTH